MTVQIPLKPNLDSEILRQRLKLRSINSERALLEKHSVAANFFKKINLRPGKIREHAARAVTSGALAGTVLLSAHSILPPMAAAQKQPQVVLSQPTQNAAPSAVLAQSLNPQTQMMDFLQTHLPDAGNWNLTPIQKKDISTEIKDAYGINAVANLDGQELNNQYGRMGAEQHLLRYPGDSESQHDELPEKGVAPHTGAWGYFAYSKADMTKELYDTEKWYVAVQTLYLPDWAKNQPFLKDWYKFRRVVVINPSNGKLVVAAIADSGPSDFTGKHFGGSPELMKYLGINYGMQNNPVVLFFLDDPEKKIPLGPVEYNIDDYLKAMEKVS